jgi:hypothetical protein
MFMLLPSFGTLLLVMAIACQEGKSAFDLEVGDCVVPPDLAAGEAADVERVRTVDCSGAHNAEVIAVFNIEGDKFPGEGAVSREAEERCPAKSTLYLYPTEESWNQRHDREVACIVEAIFDLQVGDCMNYSGTEELIESVQRVDCSEPHRAEVIYTLTMPGTAYPGDDAVGEYAWLNCPGDTDWPMTPTRDTWELAGDRDIQCMRE